ncbi:MAG: L-fucose isomerase [Clostridia bacterium]|nr:L-fucose isomerase [Clostridia bacterium]
MIYPKIGIRPIIDGRWGGVRESLEEKTMGMAKAAADLIAANVFYTDGTPAQCVISPCTIGGGAEAAKCAEFFSTQNVTATLSVTPCWDYGTETIDIDPSTVKAVWGFNGTERPGAVYLAAAMAAHTQIGQPAFSIYGTEVQDLDDNSIPEDVREKLIRFAKAAIAVGQMKGKSYVSIGNVAMGIGGSYCNQQFFLDYLGIRPEWVDMAEIRRRVDLGIYDHKEYEKALAWIKANCVEGKDYNKTIIHDRARKDWEWEFCAKMTLICRDIMLGNPALDDVRPQGEEANQAGAIDTGWHEEALGKNAIMGGFQGQRQWTDYMPNADFTETIMNTSFDWNGTKEPMTFATENDGLNGVAMLFGKLLTGGTSIFADVRTYWSPDAVERVTGWKPDGLAAGGFIHMHNSGAAALDGAGVCKGADGSAVMKPWWEVTDEDVRAMLDATKWCEADLQYFRGGGFSSQYTTRAEMPLTAVRVNYVKGLGPVLQLAEGWSVNIPENVNEVLNARSDPNWPTTWFVPRLTGSDAFKDVYSVMANWGANHCAMAYGHIGADLITLCSMLRIPVAMHNVAEKDIYRPHAWGAFGTKDPEGSDYRACAAYGPLYG